MYSLILFMLNIVIINQNILFFSLILFYMASKLIATELTKLEKLNGTSYDMWHRKIKYDMIYDKIEYVIYQTTSGLNDNLTDGEIKKREQ